MNIDQIIYAHDSILSDVEEQFPKPIGRHTFKGQPKLSLVKTKKTTKISAEVYLGKRMEHFFTDMITKAVLRK